jgi:hypothetical protein
MLTASPDGFTFENPPIPTPIEVVEPPEPPEVVVPDPPKPGDTRAERQGGSDGPSVPPVVLAFGPPWCSACPGAKNETVSSKNFDFRWNSDESKFPDWVKNAGGYPIFWWRFVGENDGHFSIGWPGLSAFSDIYKNSAGSIAQSSVPLATGEAAHTPMSEVVRVIGLLPKPEIAFVDFGCGYDARWCVAAAERWGCKCVGIEIDPQRASAARERVRNLGLDNLITILEGDAGTVPVSGDVAVAYLYPSVLARLKPRLESFKAFASYLHQPPGLNCTKNGDTWFYRRQVQTAMAQQQGAVWQGMVYNQPVCNSPHCAMCNAIRRQLGQRR